MTIIFVSECQKSDLPCHSDYRIADPLACGRYYQCGHGTRWLHRSCPRGTVFDTNIRMCGHSYEVDCNSPGRVWCRGSPGNASNKSPHGSVSVKSKCQHSTHNN